jgi:hypothetical protein
VAQRRDSEEDDMKTAGTPEDAVAAADPELDERALLFVQLLEREQPGQPLPAGVEITISGSGLPAPVVASTDEAGGVLLEDCGPGVYTLAYGERQARVHTLSDADLDSDESPYRVLI